VSTKKDVSTKKSDDIEVRAAGGVVWRRRHGVVEVLLVHRPKYCDWSLPKGKLDPGETFEHAALREVLEETGLECALGAEMVSTRYRDAKGREKLVRYWEMEPIGGKFRPNDEVDRVQWVAVGDVAAWLTYDRDLVVAREAQHRFDA